MASFDRSRAALALPGTAAETRLSGPRVGLAYEYVGHTALTVVGAASGQRYRFTPGSVQALDPRDRAALATLPLLRRR